MAGSGNPGISKLALAINNRSKDIASEATSEPSLEFGKIQNDWGLLANSFPVKIPKGEWSVLRHVGGLSFASGTAEGHSHTISPTKLKKGDTVLIAWINGYPVVLDVVVSSKKL